MRGPQRAGHSARDTARGAQRGSHRAGITAPEPKLQRRPHVTGHGTPLPRRSPVKWLARKTRGGTAGDRAGSHSRKPQQEATAGSHSRKPQREATAGSHSGKPQQEATAGSHSRGSPQGGTAGCRADRRRERWARWGAESVGSRRAFNGPWPEEESGHSPPAGASHQRPLSTSAPRRSRRPESPPRQR